MNFLSGNDGAGDTRIGRAGSAAAFILSVLALLQIAYLTMTTTWSNAIPTTTTTTIQNINHSQEDRYIAANLSSTTANNTSNLSSILVPSQQDSIPTNAGPRPTLIQNLAGELGNHLGYMAHGFAVKWYAQETFGLDLELLTLHQDRPKWVNGKNDMLRCFPKFKDWNFDRDATWDQFRERRNQQQTWLSQERQEVLDHVKDDPEDGTAFNDSLMAYLEEYAKADKPKQIEGSEISLPFLQTKGFIPNYFFDKYYDRIREVLQFNTSNESGCCAILPDEDETVFHYRNFVTDLPSGKFGLMDFGPKQTARDLFGHLQPGDKVAIISRFDNEKTEKQVNALRARGLQVRVITGQTGVQDFCVLLQTKKEVVGLALSTFATWGSLLGSARTIRLFVPVNSKLLDRQGSLDVVKHNFLYNYTHPDISKRLDISLIPLEG